MSDPASARLKSLSANIAKLLKGGPDRVSSFFINASIGNLASGQISIKYDASGPNLTLRSAPAQREPTALGKPGILSSTETLTS